MKERTIFDQASWADALEALRTRKDVPQPVPPKIVENVNMETEESGHASQALIQQKKEKILQLIDDAKQDIAESIKIELKAPKGYILFPEPEDVENEE